jgi:hypothetical protein
VRFINYLLMLLWVCGSCVPGPGHKSTTFSPGLRDAEAVREAARETSRAAAAAAALTRATWLPCVGTMQYGKPPAAFTAKETGAIGLAQPQPILRTSLISRLTTRKVDNLTEPVPSLSPIFLKLTQ